ncbi:MAG: hypothetical protein II948_00465 [Synergistaceae bacterium]|nr:hypothetical protein [Synergistaceae bacterium]MBQ4419311.1 hypothetical protein [Synergistaceae bacterium]MBQ7570569.1 hypothetical protein [Synergistaceae bacterium]MBQ9582268.1 hypothetical protein [Synergistaceae bacterium]MBR0044946.1 hypothetical protein [Synergistaceae bacterium]
MEQAQAQAIRDSALPYVSRVLDGGENLNDVMAEIYSAYFSNNAPGDICDRILAGVKSWDDNFQAAQKNPDEFVKKFQDQLEEGKTDLERCKLWLDFITGLAGDTEQENIVIDENADVSQELSKFLRDKAADMLMNSDILFSSLEEQDFDLKYFSGDKAARILIQFSETSFDLRAIASMIIYCETAKAGENLTPEQASAIACAALEEAKIIEAANKGSLAVDIAVMLLALVSLVLIITFSYEFVYIGLHVFMELFGFIAAMPVFLSIALIVYSASDKLLELVSKGSEKTVRAVSVTVQAFIKTLRALFNYAKRVVIPNANEKTKSILAEVKDFINVNSELTPIKTTA